MPVTSLEPIHGPIVMTLGSVNETVTLRNTIIYPTAPGQTAIHVTWPNEPPSSINTTLILENVVTAPGNGFYWDNHIHVTNAWNARIVGCNTIGPSGLPNPVSMNGIILDGKSTGVSISHHRASGLVTGVWIKGECEGTKLDDLDAIGVINGVVAWPDTGGGEPGLWITNSHINATAWGVHLRHRYQVTLRDLLLYAGDYYQVTQGQPFYAVVAEDCQEVRCDNVMVSRAGAAAASKPVVPMTLTRTDAVDGAARLTTW